jgi:hypothetical protein
VKLILKRLNNSFIPSTDEGVEIFSKIKEGEEILIEYKKHRNVGNHKRLFSMLQGVVSSSDHYKSVNNLLDVIKLKSGHFDTVVTHKGDAVYIPKSINFASMGEDKFKEFFSGAIDVVLEFVPEQDVNSILRYC